ncbi:hypothetical protein NIES2107_72430 (plasmid) [Nostoc carneum NIES-2107]|nr:hypothetical protein NIES2107_72430 [Nostoc carneum NIES-2107]
MRSTKQALKFFLIMALALIATLCSAKISFSQEHNEQQVISAVKEQPQIQNQNNWIFPIPSENVSLNIERSL